MTVAVTREELGAVELRREAGRCRDARAARRMLALALVLEGCSREEAARHAGMDRQTWRDWVRRYNAEGLEGLSDRCRPGPRPRLSPEQEAELVTAVEQGPDPDRDGVVRWRRVDLKALIEARFAVRLHERSIGKVLRRLGFTRLSVRPKHPKADEAAQEAFKKASPRWWSERCPSAPAGTAPASSSSPRTSPCCRSRPTRPSRTRSRPSGSTCGRTSSACGSGRATTPSSRPAAGPGTRWWRCPTGSPRSPAASGPKRSPTKAVGITSVLMQTMLPGRRGLSAYDVGASSTR